MRNGTRRTHRAKAASVRAFLSPDTSLGDLDAASAAVLISAASDVTLVLDHAGIIHDIAFQSDDLMRELDESPGWIGRPVAATVARDSRPKVEAMLRDAANTTETKWRHINHLASDGRSVPVMYCCVQLNRDGRLMAFGRDLRMTSQLQQRLVNAQQSLERDYVRLRDAEMRYRLLFQMSSEAVLILESARHRIAEANPAARTVFGVDVGELAGLPIGRMFDADSMAAVNAHLAAVLDGAEDAEVQARTAQGGREVTVRASLFRQDQQTMFLLRVTPSAAAPASATLPDVKLKLLQAVESAPDGFVVAHGDGEIIHANAAFLEMAELTREDQARGQPLDRWLGASGVDFDVLMANLRSRGSVRFFATVLRGGTGRGTDVEVSAVSVRNGGHPSFGFAIRNVGGRLTNGSQTPQRLPRSVEHLSELIGRVPLKELVREATEVIERLCIEAALELAGNNRASAAEMLGLSRQSLYVKLRRYGIGDLSGGDVGADASPEPGEDPG